MTYEKCSHVENLRRETQQSSINSKIWCIILLLWPLWFVNGFAKILNHNDLKKESCPGLGGLLFIPPPWFAVDFLFRFLIKKWGKKAKLELLNSVFNKHRVHAHTIESSECNCFPRKWPCISLALNNKECVWDYVAVVQSLEISCLF